MSSRLLFRVASVCVLPALCLLLATEARAQSTGSSTVGTTGVAMQQGAPMGGRATATNARVTTPPLLDGRADDAAWASAQVIDEFLEYEPNEGKVSRFETEVRITYDDRYLYVLGRMYDPAPDSIVFLLSRRDVRTSSGQLKLVIDSYNDKKTAFQFVTNPAGVKRDFCVSNDNNEDPSWDAVWDVATKIDSVGWVAEFRIPFSQIRYAPGDDHVFGLIVVRDIARTGERVSWPLIKRNVQGYVSQGRRARRDRPSAHAASARVAAVQRGQERHPGLRAVTRRRTGALRSSERDLRRGGREARALVQSHAGRDDQPGLRPGGSGSSAAGAPQARARALFPPPVYYSPTPIREAHIVQVSVRDQFRARIDSSGRNRGNRFIRRCRRPARQEGHRARR
ncbi:MAG: carbohydrate binding family 9 domain-containing protein [Gemmatimonadaceae bacterium]